MRRLTGALTGVALAAMRNGALKPGRYRLVGTPTDLAKNKGKSVRASFRTKR